MKQPLPGGKRPLPASRFFEDFKLGEQYIIPSRTQTSGLFAMFQSASGDNDPIHYDVEFCRQRGHDDLLAHGMQVMIQTAAGAGTFPSEVADSLMGMIEVSGRFLHPVYRGNTLYPMLEIVELKDQNTTGVIVLSPLHRSRIPPAHCLYVPRVPGLGDNPYPVYC